MGASHDPFLAVGRYGMKESRDEWIARKKLKPYWANPYFRRFDGFSDPLDLKPSIRKRATGFYEIKGQCPCAPCDHDLSYDCYIADCQCCSEVCT